MGLSGRKLESNRSIVEQTDVMQAAANNDKFWNKVDYTGEELQNEMIQGWEAYQKATGRNEKPYIDKIKAARTNAELYKIKEKGEKAMIKWAAIQYKKSGLLNPINKDESFALMREFDAFMDHFKSLPAFKGEFTKVSTLCHLDKDLARQKKFRNRIKSQSKYIQKEWARRSRSLGLLGSKEGLLNEIIEELKAVEDLPSAAQYEFKKKQEKSHAGINTGTIRKEVVAEYNKRHKKYLGMMVESEEYFGGDKVQSPYGKKSRTWVEFMDWFEELDSHAAMDDAIKKHPGVLEIRKKLYGKLDDMCAHLPAKEAKKIKKKAKLMRRHELEKALPEFDRLIRKNNLNTVEYLATIMSANEQGIRLFQNGEMGPMVRRMENAALDEQGDRLRLLKMQISDRRETVKDWLALDDHVRNDERFMRATSYERERMLIHAQIDLQKEPASPFDTSNIDDHEIDINFIENTAKAMDGYEAQKSMEEVLDEMDTTRVELADKLLQKSGRHFQDVERKNISQEDEYVEKLAFWMRQPVDRINHRDNLAYDVHATNDKERGKLHSLHAARMAHRMGFVTAIGGEANELQIVDNSRILAGDTSVAEDINKARYSDHLLYVDSSGKEVQNPYQKAQELLWQAIQLMSGQAADKLGAKMGMGGEGRAKMRHSNIMKDAIADYIADEHAQAANNAYHY